MNTLISPEGLASQPVIELSQCTCSGFCLVGELGDNVFMNCYAVQYSIKLIQYHPHVREALWIEVNLTGTVAHKPRGTEESGV